MARKKQNNEGYELLRNELKTGSFHNLYVFYGEEDYLRENFRRQLREKLVSGPAEDFNYHRFQEEDWDVGALAEAVEAIPMMSDYSLVEIVDVDLFSRPENERTILAELFESLPEYCVVLLVFDVVEWKPDKRIKKLWEPMEKAALQVEFCRQEERQLLRWIKRHLAVGGKTMTEDVARYLILQTGGSMTIMDAELEKLMSYTDQDAITKNDVDAVVIPVMEAAIFDITRDIGRKNFDGALERLRDLLRQDTEPIVICGVIGRHFRQLYSGKVLSDHGRGPSDLEKLFGIRDFAAREIYNQARGFRKPVLKQAMGLCAQADYGMKTSAGDSSQVLELMVLRLAEAVGA